MLNPFRPIVEFSRILLRRLRQQGLRVTLQWLSTVGVAWLTGHTSLRYSKVSPQIYLGPQHGRFGKRVLEKAGVTASLSLRAEFDDAVHGLAMTEYCYLPTIDNTAPSLKHLEEGADFMRKVIASGGVVYVHCASGVGRAPTMVAAYLISEGKTVDEAIEQIQAVRPFIRILPAQVARLEEYQIVQENSLS